MTLIGDELADRLVTYGVRTGAHALSRVLMFAGKEIVSAFHANGGKVTVAQLEQSQKSPVQGIEISHERAEEFDRFAKKYGFEYSLIREENDPQKYFLTFRQRDIGQLEMVVTDMMGDKTKNWDDLAEMMDHAREQAFQAVKAPQRHQEITR